MEGRYVLTHSDTWCYLLRLGAYLKLNWDLGGNRFQLPIYVIVSNF